MPRRGLQDLFSGNRWLSVSNTSGEEIPAFAVMLVIDPPEDTGEILVDKPDAADIDPADLIVNGPAPIPEGAKGQATWTFPAFILHDPGTPPADPKAGEDWGTNAGSWKLHKDNLGFHSWGTLPGTRPLFAPTFGGGDGGHDDRCCDATGLAKPLGGAPLGAKKKCCCGGGGIKPPGDDGGGGGGGGSGCDTFSTWQGVPGIGGHIQQYTSCWGPQVIIGFSQYPPPGWVQVDGGVGLLKPIYTDKPECYCKCFPFSPGCGGGWTGGGINPTGPDPCCPPGYTGLANCLVNGQMTVVNCGAPGIKGGGQLGGLARPLGGAPLGGGPIMPEVTLAANTFTDTLTVQQSTLGNPTIVTQGLTAADPVQESSIPNRVTTTTNAVTPIETYPLADNTGYAVTVRVWGRRTGGTGGTAGDFYYGVTEVAVKRTSGGGATLVGSPTFASPYRDNIIVNATISVSGNNLVVNAQGDTNNNYTWHCKIEPRPLSS